MHCWSQFEGVGVGADFRGLDSDEIARTFPHAELRGTWVWFQSGINTDGAHNWSTSHREQRGDILSLNCFR